MTERPILFSGPMVLALLNGSKTQTRRVVKPQPYADSMGNACWNGSNFGQDASGPLFKSLASPLPSSKTKRVRCPYGKPGDRLWVRETWSREFEGGFCYRADDAPEEVAVFVDAHGNPLKGSRWKPSIHMPREASRILLEVTGVRVERLQDISEADAIAEGIERLTHGGITTYRNYALSDELASVSPMLESPIESYRTLWESINNNRPKLPTNTSSKRYARVLKWLETHPDTTGWDANPWVWVIEFKRLETTA